MINHTDTKQAVWPWLFMVMTLAVGLVGFALFFGNRNVSVPASWGVAGGARNTSGDLLNTLQQAVVMPGVACLFGILILRRQPHHRIGWLLIAISLIAAMTVLLAEWAAFGFFVMEGPTAGARVAAWATNWVWIVLISVVLLMIALFPNGRFLSSRWQMAYAVGALLFLLPGLIAAAIETPMTSAFQIPNPFVATHRPQLYNSLFYLAVALMFVTTIIVLAQTIARYRLRLGVERAQIKWLLAGVALFAFMMLTGILLAADTVIVRDTASPASVTVRGAVGAFIVNAAPLAVLVGIGIAMVRHQLYDIDFLIRRTTSYALLTGLLAIIYASSVILLQRLLSPVTGESTIAVVLSTLLIAALFLPVRRRVQTAIDRRFFRQKYDAQKTLERFALTVRDETDLDALTAELVRVIQESMQPEMVSIWLRSTELASAQDWDREATLHQAAIGPEQ